MSASTGTLWRILREQNPIAVVYYPERVTRQDLIEQIRLMAPSDLRICQTSSLDEAIADPTSLVVLTPEDEEATVELLDRRREELRDRTAPVVLFLLCDGTGEERLRRAFALASWLRGREYDPSRPQWTNLDDMRGDFQRRTGCSPEQWMASWRAGSLPDTLENNLLSHEAISLEESL